MCVVETVRPVASVQPGFQYNRVQSRFDCMMQHAAVLVVVKVRDDLCCYYWVKARGLLP